MDWFNETSFYPLLAPQLMWIKILELCAVILLATALLTLVVGWVRHLSWRVRLLALLPLAASIGAGSIAHHLHDTYIYWNAFLGHLPYSYPAGYYNHIMQLIFEANNQAELAGWFAICITGILLMLGLYGGWRAVASGGRGQLPASLALES
jgi:hypothetical protein